MMLSVQDPIYQNTVWQAPAAEAAQLEQQLAALHEGVTAWQQQDEAQRQWYIATWHEAIKQADHLPQKLGCYCGMTLQQSQDWLKAITMVNSSQQAIPVPGVAMLLNNSIEPNLWSTLWACLRAGNAVLLGNTVPVAAIVAELIKLCPTEIPVSAVAVATLAQSLWQQANMCALYCFSDALTASDVHKALAGRFNLPAYFHTPLCHQVLLPPEAEIDAALDSTLAQALICSGQYFSALRQIIVFKSQYSAVLNQLIGKMKAFRVAAYDAKPQPGLSSLCSTAMAEQIYQAFLALRNMADIKIHLPMRKLLNGTGMLTPGLIEVSLHQLAQIPVWCAPLLQLVVIDDLTQVAEVACKLNAPGNLYVYDANQGTLNKLKLVLRHNTVKTLTK